MHGFDTSVAHETWTLQVVPTDFPFQDTCLLRCRNPACILSGAALPPPQLLSLFPMSLCLSTRYYRVPWWRLRYCLKEGEIGDGLTGDRSDSNYPLRTAVPFIRSKQPSAGRLLQMSILQPSASSIERLRHTAMFSRSEDMGITAAHVQAFKIWEIHI